jgi:predicted DNA-binding ribbon-helix-helix protein
MPVTANGKRSTVVKRSIKISGSYTSVHLEDAFWDALGEIAAATDTTRSRLVEEINQTRNSANLSSAVRLFVLGCYRGSGP